MATGYTPKWKTDKGDVLIFPASNTLFDNLGDASDWRLDQFLFMIPFGLSSAGILEFEHQNGRFQMPQEEVDVGMLGSGIVIDGQMLDEAIAEKSQEKEEVRWTG